MDSRLWLPASQLRSQLGPVEATRLLRSVSLEDVRSHSNVCFRVDESWVDKACEPLRPGNAHPVAEGREDSVPVAPKQGRGPHDAFADRRRHSIHILVA